MERTNVVALAHRGEAWLWHGGGADEPALVVALGPRLATREPGAALLFVDGIDQGFTAHGLAVAAKLGLFGFAVVGGEDQGTFTAARGGRPARAPGRGKEGA